MLQATDNEVDRLTRFQSGLLNSSDVSLDSNNSTERQNNAPKLSKNLMAAMTQGIPQVNPNNLSEAFSVSNVNGNVVNTAMSKLDDRPVEDLINDAEKDLPESTKMNIIGN